MLQINTCYICCFGSKEMALLFLLERFEISKGIPQMLCSVSAVEGKWLAYSAKRIRCIGYGTACFPYALGRDSSWLWEREFPPSAFFQDKVGLLHWKVIFQLWPGIYQNFSVICF